MLRCLQFIALLLLAGCSKPATSLPEGRTPPNPSAPARYGEPRPGPSPAGAAAVRESAPPALTLLSPQPGTGFFQVVESELFPGVLVRSPGRYLGLFNDLARVGLEAPRFVAWSTPSGPRVFKNGEDLDVLRMEENWVLVWFAGATGWTNGDSPWAVFLQHRPASMKLNAEGLHFTFSNRVGDVVLLPLYGAEWLPAKGQPPALRQDKPSAAEKLRTWEWATALPRDPLVRLRYWAGATRRIPVDVDETFRVRRAEDSLMFRWRFAWHAIEDEWKTKPLRLAPLSPTLALALREPAFPARFDAHPFDLEMFTPYGPWYGVPDVDEFSATLPLLQYVHETEVIPVRGGTNVHPAVAAAGRALSAVAADAAANGVWHELAWVAKALPQLDTPARDAVAARLKSRLSQRLEAKPGPGGAPAVGVPGLLEACWAYAHFSGDWDWARRQWPALRPALAAAGDVTWAGFGRERMAAGGDLAAPWIALARLAYQAGDLEAYHQACALLAHDLVQLWVRQRGAAYFRQHQPSRPMEPWSDPLVLTELDGREPGWRLDGPKCSDEGRRQRYAARWMRFSDGDVARFYQDYLGPDLRRELASLAATGATARGVNHQPQELPFLVQLRSLLLQESPGALAAMASPETFSGGVGGRLAAALCVLRTAEPARYERLIPAGKPSESLAGGTRGISGDGGSPGLMFRIVAPAGDWPAVGRPGWGKPVGGVWTLGAIKSARYGVPAKMDVIPVGRHARILSGEPR